MLLLLLAFMPLAAAAVVPVALAIGRDGYSPVAFDPSHDTRGGAS